MPRVRVARAGARTTLFGARAVLVRGALSSELLPGVPRARVLLTGLAAGSIPTNEVFMTTSNSTVAEQFVYVIGTVANIASHPLFGLCTVVIS